MYAPIGIGRSETHQDTSRLRHPPGRTITVFFSPLIGPDACELNPQVVEGRHYRQTRVYPEFRSCEALWEETPHPARYSRHPLPKGEG